MKYLSEDEEALPADNQQDLTVAKQRQQERQAKHEQKLAATEESGRLVSAVSKARLNHQFSSQVPLVCFGDAATLIALCSSTSAIPFRPGQPRKAVFRFEVKPGDQKSSQSTDIAPGKQVHEILLKIAVHSGRLTSAFMAVEGKLPHYKRKIWKSQSVVSCGKRVVFALKKSNAGTLLAPTRFWVTLIGDAESSIVVTSVARVRQRQSAPSVIHGAESGSNVEAEPKSNDTVSQAQVNLDLAAKEAQKKQRQKQKQKLAEDKRNNELAQHKRQTAAEQERLQARAAAQRERREAEEAAAAISSEDDDEEFSI